MQENLKLAKKNKNDEFYTQLTDIEKEMKHYRSHFKDKVVYMNCDDPEWSNFWIFFKMNFDFLGLKKIISTHYHDDHSTYKMEFDGKEIIKTELVQNGDFRSPESIELLKESDIVVTNPPFSLFREYIAQLMKYDKKFIIIGNFNAITYKEVFPLIKDNKVWTGISPRSMKFKTPTDELKTVNAVWFTNLDHIKRHEDILLFREYKEELYPKYDNYDAIEVSKVADIPMDYYGIMGVPITFMSSFNPEQFELIGITDRQNTSGLRNKVYGKETPKHNDLNARSTLKIDGQLKSVYARILIKRRLYNE